MIPSNLPIHAVLPDLLAALEVRTNAVLVAPPGAGKTTSIPLALLDAPWLDGRKIVMLAPRRLAARSAAARMASLLGENVGQTVGYRVRLDSKVSHKTRVEVVTEGIFNRMILADPELTGYAIVIFDEVHERNLDGDLALALSLDSQAGLREDLRILAMSATLDGARIASLMGEAPIVESAGRMFPIATHYVGATREKPIEIQTADVALQSLNQGPGDVLAFLPGISEINRAMAHIAAKGRSDLVVVGLHGSLDPREQDQALTPAPNGQRKIIFATSIAETSLTIGGVQIVIDCGLTRRAAYEPDSGLTRLVTLRASRASADQRRGRAGRTAPGLCFRLWEEAQTGAFPAFERPEILEADLSPLALNLASWGVVDPAQLAWLDTPPKPAWQEAVGLLQSLDALDVDGRLTSHGKALSEFGLPPRLAHMIVAAGQHGFGTTAAWVAALLSENGLGGNDVDLTHRLINFKRDGSARAIKARGQAQNWAKQVGALEPMSIDEAGRALALAFPERIAKARDRRGGFVLRNGRGGEIAAEDSLSTAPFLAVGALQGRAGNARIAEAATLSRADLDDLFKSAITSQSVATFDKANGTMRGRLQTRLGALILDDKPTQLSTSEVHAGLLQAVDLHGITILNWTPKAQLLRARLMWLHLQNPEKWPSLSDATLQATLSDWLAPELVGVTSLYTVDVAQALLNTLEWSSRAMFEQEAPERFETPAQTSYAIDYGAEQGPTVALRVQEVFGLLSHPMLNNGKTPLVFQLLSPAHRPIATTSDLPSFWKGAWMDVRKDMKARYPRHVWPEDPALAMPTTRAKPRGT